MFERHTRAEQIPVPARGFARNHDRNDCTEAHFTVTLAERHPAARYRGAFTPAEG
jgi:hypothetical protein